MPTAEEIEARLREETPFYAQAVLKIVNEDGLGVPFIPRPAQLKVEAALAKQKAEGKPGRVIILKSRRTGVSRYGTAKLIHRCTTIENRRAVIVAHDTDTAGELFDDGAYFYSSIPNPPEAPEWLKPHLSSDRNTEGAKIMAWGEPVKAERQRGNLGINSTLKIGTAKSVEAGRGKTITDLWCCLVADAPVIVDDGQVVPVSEVKVGARVITHTGQPATVTGLRAGRPTEENGAGRTIKVTPWLGEMVEMTPNHPVWTERGWVEAGDLTLKDRVAMPVRDITHTTLFLRLPSGKTPSHGGGRKSVGAGELLELDEEVGFAFGYYLAEGSVARGSVTFTRHRGEGAYAERAIAALAHLSTSRRITDRAGCLTTQETIYGTPLARLIADEFGTTTDKRVPDWAFTAGPDFLRGFLAGYLSGDGSKTNKRAGAYAESAVVVAPTICSSLATQFRDIAAALGYGWASITTHPGGDRYGRKCRPSWVVRWHGAAARGLRELIGLEVPVGGRPQVEKSEVRDGMVWMRIRRLDEGHTDYVYDLQVDHPDHSFRTLHFAVHNTEVAHWDNPKKMLAMVNAVFDRPGTIIALESTANGHNFFKSRWDRAVRGESEYTPVFISWLEDPNCWLDFDSDEEREEFIATIGTGEWGDDEPALVERGATPEQLRWRRRAIVDKADGHLDDFKQEYPSFPAEAFIASGRHVFSMNFVQKVIERTNDTDLQAEIGVFTEKGVKVRRLLNGELEVPTGALWVPKAATGFAATHDFWKVWEHPWRGWDTEQQALPQVPADERENAEERVQAREGVRAYEHPGQYICSADVADGEENTNGDKAWHAIQVIDHLTGEQVAVYRSREDLDVFTRKLLLAALYFNQAWIVVETTGSHGLPAARSLALNYGYAKVYRRPSHGNLHEKQQDRLGWDTNRRTKPLIISTMTALLREGTDGIRDRQTALEFQTYVELPRGGQGPDDDAYADLLMAWGIAQQVRTEIPARRTFDPPRPTGTRLVPRRPF